MMFLDKVFAGLYRRIEVAEALGCQSKTIAVLVAARGAVLAVDTLITDDRIVRLRKRAEALGWVPCNIHTRYIRRPRIDCYGCRRTNTARGEV